MHCVAPTDSWFFFWHSFFIPNSSLVLLLLITPQTVFQLQHHQHPLAFLFLLSPYKSIDIMRSIGYGVFQYTCSVVMHAYTFFFWFFSLFFWLYSRKFFDGQRFVCVCVCWDCKRYMIISLVIFYGNMQRDTNFCALPFWMFNIFERIFDYLNMGSFDVIVDSFFYDYVYTRCSLFFFDQMQKFIIGKF